MTDGKLTIEPRKVTLTSASDKKEYDGNDEKLKALSQEAFERSIAAARDLTAKIKAKLPSTRINYLMLDYFRDSADMCGMPYDLKL